MKRRDYLLLVAISVIAGLFGGILSNRAFTGKPAFAQETLLHETVVTAGEFRLVAKGGKPIAALSTSPESGEPFLVLYGKDGKYRALLELAGDSPRLILRDSDSKTRVVLGSTELTTTKGAVRKRPESSLVMFNKDGKLIWSAP